MSLKPQGNTSNPEFDPSIPLWKRELILRKRARAHSSPNHESRTGRELNLSSLLSPPIASKFEGLGSPYQSKFSYHTVYSTRKDDKVVRTENGSLIRNDTALGKASVRGSNSSPQLYAIQGCSRSERHCESSVGVKLERERDVNVGPDGSCDHSYVITCHRPILAESPDGQNVGTSLKMSPVLNCDDNTYTEMIESSRNTMYTPRAHNDHGSHVGDHANKRKGNVGIDSRAQFRHQPSPYSNGGLMLRNGIISRQHGGLPNGLHNGVDDSDSGSEFEYGPGIVNKLRSKFINLTIRQQKDIKRPALRKVASLENLLDSDPCEYYDKGYSGRSRPKDNSVMSKSQQQEPGRVWKAKSMETLSTLFDGRGAVITDHLKSVSDLTANFDPQLKKSKMNGDDISKGIESLTLAKNVVIIEATNNHPRVNNDCSPNSYDVKTRLSGSASENEEELPRPDMVKQIKKLYEPNSPKKQIRKGSVSVMKNNYKNTLLRQVNVPKNSRPSVENVLPIRPPSDNSVNINVKTDKIVGTKPPERSPVTGTKPEIPPKNGALYAKVPSQSPLVNHIHVTTPKLNKELIKSVDLPTNLPTCNEISTNVTNQSINSVPKVTIRSDVVSPRLPEEPRSIPSTPTKTESSAPSAPLGSTPKQVGVIKPMSVVEEKNKKNLEGTENVLSKKYEIETSPQKSKPEMSKAITPKTTDSASKSVPKERGKPTQSTNNCLVFNFSQDSKKEIPNYIEYDGLDLSNRKKKAFLLDGKIAGQESTDGDDDEPLDSLDSVTCDMIVEGGYVVINGKSSLFRGIRKSLKISFAEKHTLHEYPSEQSVFEEYLLVEGGVTDDSLENSASNYLISSVANSAGGLASYTPSKHHVVDFQLGVSSSKPVSTIKSPVTTLDKPDEYLKPASIGHSYSEETSSDLLF